MSSVSDSYDDSVPQTESTHTFEDDNGGYVGYNPQQFDSFAGGDDDFEPQAPVYSAVGEFAPEENGKELDGEFGESDGAIWPPPSEMEAEEGFPLREWRRENVIRLEEKEKREKEVLSQIIEEADQYKVEFYRKREITCENNKTTNREKEKVFVASQEKFHAEADKNYWKAIAELIPNEVPAIEKKRGKKDQEKKPGIVVIQGPKPGKPTDLSRLRQILIKLKHNTPPHLKPSPPPAPAPAKDAKGSDDAAAAPSVKAAAVVTATEAVAVA
ncbi:clathrin light chain 2 [Jatropha curcas]|nr:clathrin light chain 2 [Jatropha curcas]